jgi:hypothetical protein
MSEPRPCRWSECPFPVPADSPAHQRLRLCALHAAWGCLLLCERCGESSPEHGPGGRGCATFLPAPEEVPHG